MTRPLYSVLLLALFAAGFSTHGLAQMDHSQHGSPAMAPASTATALEEGLVKKIDKAAGKVTLTHAAQSNGMPAMTMVYRVKNAALLDPIKVGQKVRFATDPADAGSTIVRLEPAK